MPDKFDPYREALVIETETVWPDGCPVPAADRPELEARLHAEPQSAADLQYVRLHAGFARKITVAEADLSRLDLAARGNP